MELRTVFVQPLLSGYVVNSLTVTVVTEPGIQSVSTLQGMTIIADTLKRCKIGMLILSMNPDGPFRRPAAIGAEVARKAAGDIGGVL